MAWLVIVCGFLLAVGGGFSLLMGFDIVMTERGSAMTIGGVIALSGGVIALGIGFALLKLTAILRSLDARAGRAPRSLAIDRPVVPLQADVAPPPPRVATAALGAAAGIAAAGLATGAAARAPAPEPEPEPARLPDLDPVALEPIGMREADPPLPPPPAEAAPAMERRPAPPDLEAELSRALAEVDDPPRPRRSFADGLQELLDRPPASPERGPGREFEPLAAPEAVAPAVEAEPMAAMQADPFPEATVADDTDGAEVSAVQETANAGHDGQIDGDASETEAMEILEDMEPQVDEADASEEERVPPEDDAAQADAAAAVPQESGMGAGPAETALERPMPPPAARQQAVLGSYSIGGRTYRMFADGSVEAETESGVQRFTSMDELRRHLAGG